MNQESRTPKTKDTQSAPDPEKQAQKLEHTIADLTQRLQDLEGEIAECFGDSKNTHRLKQLNAAHADLQKELQTAEAALEQVIVHL